MLFNWYAFLFAFLPITLVAVLGLAATGRRVLAKAALVMASLVFYGWWNPRYLLLLLFLLVFTYGMGQLLLYVPPERQRLRRSILWSGVLTYLGVLGYFKYANFLTDGTNVLMGTHFELARIVLPLGLSFMTFQKVAFLVDIYHGAVRRVTWLDFCLFVTFFPQLIAGPIVHHKEVIPQFEERGIRVASSLLVGGVALLVIGLLKKVIIADAIAAYATPVFDTVQSGMPVDFLAGWLGAVSYTLQLYFDFSGYCDMALGLALMFGIYLPLNFNSPFKAVNTIDFWQRWHMTLTHFLTAYIYNPLSLMLTRRWITAGRGVRVSGRMAVSAFVALLALPTFVTMTLAGIWHGAGFQFVVFGMLHGLYLVLNHVWHTYFRNASSRVPHWAGVALNFIAVAVAFVFFRAASVVDGMAILKGMAGFNGVVLPEIARLAPLRDVLVAHGFGFSSATFGPRPYAVILILLGAIWFAPNSMELMANFVETRRFGGPHAPMIATAPRWALRPTVSCAVLFGVGAAYVLLQMSQTTQFLYFTF